MRPTSRTTTCRAALLAAVVAALTLAGCGDSDDVESRGPAERGGGRGAAAETTTTTAPATTTTPSTTTSVSATSTTGPAGGSATPTTTTPPGARPTELTLVAKNLAFDRQLLQVPVAQAVTLIFDNQDEGIPHNLHIRGLPGGDVVTEVVSGPEKQEVQLEVGQAGSYAFQCDVHPTEMVGNVEVA